MCLFPTFNTLYYFANQIKEKFAMPISIYLSNYLSNWTLEIKIMPMYSLHVNILPFRRERERIDRAIIFDSKIAIFVSSQQWEPIKVKASDRSF